MTHCIDVNGFTMYNAWTAIDAVDPVDIPPNFVSMLEQEYNIKIKSREIIDAVNWQYFVEFASPEAAILFLLKFG
jgi:hypothetical protein